MRPTGGLATSSSLPNSDDRETEKDDYENCLNNDEDDDPQQGDPLGTVGAREGERAHRRREPHACRSTHSLLMPCSL